MAWEIIVLDEVEEWFLALAKTSPADTEQVSAAIDMLEQDGPTLGRPVVDRIKGSSKHKMKELRPSGTSIRILFIFDQKRQAVLLVAGDKSGQWNEWYPENIPVAEQRYEKWEKGGYADEREL